MPGMADFVWRATKAPIVREIARRVPLRWIDYELRRLGFDGCGQVLHLGRHRQLLLTVSRVRIGYPSPIRLASARGTAGADGCSTTPVASTSTLASG